MPARRRPYGHGSTTRRGYGTEHQRLRAQWRAVIDEDGADCARCGELIEPGAPFHLDHGDDRQSYLGPSHPGCNVAASNRSRGDRAGRPGQPLAAEPAEPDRDRYRQWHHRCAPDKPLVPEYIDPNCKSCQGGTAWLVDDRP